jgi:alcohol dehydrogenase class IV
MLGLNGNTDDELIDSLTDLLRRLNKSLNQPFKLKEFGVEEAKCEKHMDHMAAGADEDPGTPLNPREVSEEDMKKIYIAANNGDEDNQSMAQK